ncbi:glycosyltransferase family 2 protein [Kovacikia minuta CCNUW1]|uniref:glycosyltransferase family 2 protein n=1 Tax=Kovacikia minuta TaxID=2931930 RepID=UPI001CCE2FA0|nr:glycosyltransferase family 2 protein [Kovacikia minuta]UBF23592.1 glycosyltransferase family 2 protein [Kovacikia minuta CCNUW1]
MKLSVILPCYNGEDTLAVQLEALANQQWSGSWELIFVNNGSTDQSVEIAESYRDRFPELRIVNAYTPPGPRLGVPHSYNVGIKAATGDAFVFCESDDEVGYGWLMAMGQALLEHEFIAARIDYRKLNQPWLWTMDSDAYHQETELAPCPVPPHLPYARGCTFGMRRSVYEELGELNTGFPCSVDTEYCWRAHQAGIPIRLVPEAVIHYRLRHNFKAMYKQGRTWGKDFMRLCRRYQSKNHLGDFAALRLILRIPKSLLKGAWLYWQMLMKVPGSRTRYARWIWMLGYGVGELQGIFAPVEEIRAQINVNTPSAVSSH